MHNNVPVGPKKMQVASDRDQEIKLIAERAGVGQASALLDEAGSFAKAMECGGRLRRRANPQFSQE
ncbi:MAG: hypothetical protein EOQ50_19410 [Mesorhizobium sp.]|uniref:hypothetical protein n=1 Tax=Mesorhizobium sp. TaxID=1871066 RepID=UPI000FE81ECF|nr:hypothetical protein [Mesorhizobium sp.]RWB72404.1 MAG: hypothetical protein EOQ50_19410 [Mesorhizobium sp.]